MLFDSTILGNRYDTGDTGRVFRIPSISCNGLPLLLGALLLPYGRELGAVDDRDRTCTDVGVLVRELQLFTRIGNTDDDLLCGWFRIGVVVRELGCDPGRC